jgi:hypothetical protein
MLRSWFWVWLMLLLGFLVTGWGLPRVLRVAPHPVPGDSLVSLGKATLAALEAAQPAATVGKSETSDLQTAAEQEALLLQLRDLEFRIQQRGAEVALADSYDAWKQSSRAMFPPGRRDAMLSVLVASLIRWIELSLNAGSGIEMTRAQLLPEAGSDFPALAFEFTGVPDRLGGHLLSYLQTSGAWELSEFQLLAGSPGEDWWLRGSVVFKADPRS